MLLDHLGRPIKKSPLRNKMPRGGVVSGRFGQRGMYGELNAETIVKALKEADQGRPKRFQQLMDRIEDRDGHYWALLQSRRMAVTERPFRCVPADKSRKAKMAADYCQDVLDNLLEFEEECQALLGAVARGYKHAQIIWDRDLWIPTRLEEWDPKLFVGDKDDPYTMRLLTEAAPIDGEVLTPGQWIALQYRAKHGLPGKAGLGRIVVWYHMFKQFSVKDWLTFSELYGTPARIGYYRTSMSDEDMKVLERAVMGFGHDLAALMPDGARIEFPDAGSKTATMALYKGMQAYCNAEMSKAVLAQTMTTDQGKNGARSLGEVYERKENRLLASDSRALANALRRDVLKPTVMFKYGADCPAPRLEVDLQNKDALLKRVEKLTAMGLPVERRWLYDTFGIPAPPGEENGVIGQTLREEKPKKAEPSENLEMYL